MTRSIAVLALALTFTAPAQQLAAEQYPNSPLTSPGIIAGRRPASPNSLCTGSSVQQLACLAHLIRHKEPAMAAQFDVLVYQFTRDNLQSSRWKLRLIGYWTKQRAPTGPKPFSILWLS